MSENPWLFWRTSVDLAQAMAHPFKPIKMPIFCE
jgi:hypothetical protein